MDRPAALRSYIRLGAPIYYGGLRALGVPALNRRWQDAGLIVCYHNVVQDGCARFGEPGLHVPQARFQWQIRWLARHYSVISLGAFVDRLQTGASMRSVAAVTFDDGYAGVFECAVPILRRLSIPATVFLVANAAERSPGFWWDRPEIVQTATRDRRDRWLSDLHGDGDAIVQADGGGSDPFVPQSHRASDWSTIRAAIGRGIDIGVHSTTHRSLPTLSDAELDDEVLASRSAILDATGTFPEFFAYPYGRWDSRVRARIRTAGYRGAVTLDTGLNRAFADPWSLRRVNVPAHISSSAFVAWTAGLHPHGTS